MRIDAESFFYYYFSHARRYVCTTNTIYFTRKQRPEPPNLTEPPSPWRCRWHHFLHNRPQYDTMALTVPLSWLTDATNTQVPGVNDWGDIENTIRLQGLPLSHKLQKTATPLPMIQIWTTILPRKLAPDLPSLHWASIMNFRSGRRL